MRERPRAIWKMVVLVLVVGFGGAVVTAAAIRDHELREQVGRAIGGALVIAAIAAGLLQWWRLHRWDEAAGRADVGEAVVATVTGQRIVDGRPQPGRLDLTATRLIFYRASRFNGFVGDVASLFGAGRRYRALELPLANVESTARSEFRSIQNGLDVAMTDGAVHRFMLDFYGPFDAALRKALAAARAAAATPT